MGNNRGIQHKVFPVASCSKHTQGLGSPAPACAGFRLFLVDHSAEPVSSDPGSWIILCSQLFGHPLSGPILMDQASFHRQTPGQDLHTQPLRWSFWSNSSGSRGFRIQAYPRKPQCQVGTCVLGLQVSPSGFRPILPLRSNQQPTPVDPCIGSRPAYLRTSEASSPLEACRTAGPESTDKLTGRAPSHGKPVCQDCNKSILL